MNFLNEELYKQALPITITIKSLPEQKTKRISKHELHYYSKVNMAIKKC